MNTAVRTGELLTAATRLGGKGFMDAPDDALSLWLPGTRQLLVVQAGAVRTEDIDALTSGTAAVHAECYRSRPDVGAVATLSPPWSQLLARRGGSMPVLFDEQARHLGRPWHLRASLATRLRSGGNAGVQAGRLLVLGVTLRRTLFNAELFEKCAQAFVLAQASGRPVAVLPRWVCYIANRRLHADQKRAAASHAAGEDAAELQAY